MQAGRDDRSLGELFTELAQETSTLVRQEVELARAEVGEKVGQIGRSVASILIGGAVAYAGFLAILVAIIAGLTEFGLEGWLSALIVGVAVAAIGGFLIYRALNALQEMDMAPRRTVETLKEDQEWVKEQVG